MLLLITTIFTIQTTMTFDTVKKGHDLDKIEAISFEKFFHFWVQNHKTPKLDINTRELYRDPTFTYFRKNKI